MNRRIRAGVLAAALALVLAPALSGCNPIEQIVEGATGGDVSLGGSLPDGFPSEVPVVEGEILLGIGVGDKDQKVYNVTVKTDGDPTQKIKDAFAGAGFTEQTAAQATTDEGQSFMFTSDAWGALVVIGQADGAWTVNYTVTATTTTG